MNTSTISTKFARILMIVALAATLALSATVGQGALGFSSTAHACQGSGGGGGC